ncbi:MAG: hypothetical protein H0V70_25720 [Ktedonobacteraceae bacterium]|nr:hypothetical protein [Ktedonobacteraceae bacterium]
MRGRAFQQAQVGGCACGVLGLGKRVDVGAFARDQASQPASHVARIPGTGVHRIGDGGGDEAVDIQRAHQGALVGPQVVLDADVVTVQEHILVLRLGG